MDRDKTTAEDAKVTKKAPTEVSNRAQEELARQVGKSRSALANSLRLLNLPEDIQADIDWASCEAQMRLDVDAILETYFEMEDPSSIEAIGVERNIAATINDAPLRGILDRLDQNDDGSITIVDYKTGKPPRAGYENDALANSQIYAALCEAEIGQLPTNIRLLYVAHGSTLDVAVSPVVVRARAKSAATVWQRINTFYADGEFPADPSPRTCRWCAYKDVCRERGVPVPV